MHSLNFSDSEAALLHHTLTQLYPRSGARVRSARPVPALHRGARVVTLEPSGVDERTPRRCLALFLPRAVPGLDPAIPYRHAQQHGLPAPVILARAEDADQVLLLCQPPTGRSIEETLWEARAPWEISSAAVSVARFLARLHRTVPGALGLADTANDRAHASELRLTALRVASDALPNPVGHALRHALEWIDRNLDRDATEVPTLASPRLAALFAADGEIEYVLGWERLAMGSPADTLADLLLDAQRFQPAVREQFISVTAATYLQDGAASVSDVPARVLLAYLEHVTIGWSARASLAAPSPQAAEAMVAALENALRASQRGLVAVARHDFTP
ncbi:MAG: aminoglycoside phosphotransferase family protein [Thermomicrobium sp.]|nr:aminoglycoside phosphotransferase family protein [Thermomicrobium sp.]